MNRRRSCGLFAAAALAAVGVAGCGASSNHNGVRNASAIVSTPDPANEVPATAVAYASIVIKPGGSLKTNLVQTIDKLAGRGVAEHLGSEISNRSGAKFQQISSWASGTAGIALTAIPTGPITQQALLDDLLVVVPTSDPAAAKRFIADNPPKYAGVKAEVVGDYAIAGGAAALAQEASVIPTNSLASDPAFQSATAQIGGDELATVFVRPRPLVQALAAKLGSSMTQAQLSAALQKIPAGSTVALGATAGPNTLSFDAVTKGFPQTSSSASPSDVGSLPGTSWLALAVGGALANPDTISMLEGEAPALLAQVQSKAGAAGSSVQGLAPFLENDLIPALGPISLSVSGTSLSSLRVGLELTSDNPSAEGMLAGALGRMLKGLPVDTRIVGKHLLVTFGYSSAQDLLSPASQLSDNPTYQAALAQLPAGSHVPVYLDFGPIAELGSLFDSNQSDASIWKIAGRLNYLIAGGTSTHMRVVLAVK